MKAILTIVLIMIGCGGDETPHIPNGVYVASSGVVETCCTNREGGAAKCVSTSRKDITPGTWKLTLFGTTEERTMSAAGCTFTVEDQVDQLIAGKPPQWCTQPNNTTTIMLRQLSIAQREDGSLVYESDRLIDNQLVPYTCSVYAHYILEPRP